MPVAEGARGEAEFTVGLRDTDASAIAPENGFPRG